MSMRKPVGLGLIIGILALAFAALPALASAAPTYDPPNGKFPAPFTSVGGAATLNANGLPSVTCTKQANSGQFTTGTTGDVEVTFTGCTESTLGTACTTPGQASGTITTEQLGVDLVYLNKAHTTGGALLTPPATGKFANFTCLFGSISIAVTGNGVIGDISAPAFTVKSKTLTLNFQSGSSNFIQKFQQIEEAGTKFHLNASTGGTPVEAAEVAEDVITPTGGGEGQLTDL